MARGSWFRKVAKNGATPGNIPDGLWSKCPKCSEISFAKDVEKNFNVCPKCEYHHKLRANERITMMVDEGSFREFDADITALDPLGFPDYADKIVKAREKTGLTDSLVTGYATIEERPFIVGAADFAFMGGSMGSVLGEKVTRAMERGIEERLPVIMFTANGGGARMQEGILSLMQMAKTSAAAAKMDRAGIPYIVVLTDPTMAGVYASFAALGDVILAEPGALIGFAGRRVGNQDVGGKLPEDFQTSEFQFRCGMVDRIVSRKDLRGELARLLKFYGLDNSGMTEQRVELN
ncbi:MAG: acetyl-CoA carboxylase carboxyltransferase subunit beta [Chthonomonadaceae bacterium]|nr:acetyl-CoA carboxylase carboxyltransferase subunit beta [Chthonomonadaceae bacterium]